MKKQYEKPIFEIISFDVKEDIMTDIQAYANDDDVVLGGSGYDNPPF